jgi:hypothetical protein
MDIPGSNLIGNLNVLPTAAPTAGGQLAALEAQLKKLFKAETQIDQNPSLDAKTRKEMAQSLQTEIQMVMQRIADLESGKKNTPITEAAVPTKIDKDALPSELVNGALPSPQTNKIDVSV